ncbi:MAG: Minf_1886 family protein [Candidatus Omnitrophota bacterium]
MDQEANQIMEQLCASDTRYRRDAYDFILEALSFTQKKFRRVKHVSGKELLEGAKELLISRFGPMTLSVLEYWGIKTTEDFGYIVFNLVEHKILSRTDEDSMEDFKNGYDFQKVFNAEYQEKLAKQIRKLRGT